MSEWPQLDQQHVRSFAARSHRRGLAARSVQRRLSAVRTFCHFLIREGELAANPALDVQAPKGKRLLPVTLDADTMARLLEFRTDDRLGLRDKAIMELFYSSGLRLAELLGLDLVDLDLKDRTVRVLGKGRKSRIVPVGRQAVDALRRWLAERATLAAVGETAVFVGRNGTRLGPRIVQRRIARLGDAPGVCPSTCTRTCSGIRSRATCSNRAATCARCRNCSGMRTSPPRRSTRTSTSSTWPRCTTLRTLAPAAAGTPVPRARLKTERPETNMSDSRAGFDPHGTTILCVRRDGRRRDGRRRPGHARQHRHEGECAQGAPAARGQA